jgi:hypothetical protein
MSNRTDAEHQYFARVPTRLLADLTSSDGPIFTFIAADSQLHVNKAALKARSAERRARGEMPVPLPVPPIVFAPAPEPVTPNRHCAGGAA